MSLSVFITSITLLTCCGTFIIHQVWNERNNTYRKYIEQDSLLNDLRQVSNPVNEKVA